MAESQQPVTATPPSEAPSTTVVPPESKNKTASATIEQKTESTEEQPEEDSPDTGDENNNDDDDDNNNNTNNDPAKKDAETATDATAESVTVLNKKDPIVSSNKKSRPPYKYDPDKITLRFLFANRDGLTVTIECNPSDTVGEVKAALLSVWPSGEFLLLLCLLLFWNDRKKPTRNNRKCVVF